MKFSCVGLGTTMCHFIMRAHMCVDYMRIAVVAARAVTLAVALSPAASEAAGDHYAYSAPEVRTQVLSESGVPIQGAIVVARWGLIETPIPPSLLSGNFSIYAGHSGPRSVESSVPLHIEETRADAQGEFRFSAWKSKRLPQSATLKYTVNASHTPQLFVVAPGFLPLRIESNFRAEINSKGEFPVPAWNGTPLRMKARAANDTEYVAALSRIQSELPWSDRDNSDAWKRVPQLVAAIQYEKMKLGERGTTLLGMDRLPGKSGRGSFLYAVKETGRGAVTVVLRVDWLMQNRLTGETRTRREYKEINPLVREAGFFVSKWRELLPPYQDWFPDPASQPIVHVYAPGYLAVRDIRWSESGGNVTLQPWPAGLAKLDELRKWRRDIDQFLTEQNNSNEALRVIEDFLFLMDTQCSSLPPDKGKGICFETGGDVRKYLDGVRAERAKGYTKAFETAEGILQHGAGALQTGIRAVSHPNVRATGVPSIRGISVPPAGQADSRPSQWSGKSP